MAQAKLITDDTLAMAVNDAAKGLSRRARAALVSHPEALRVALAVAAETLEAKANSGAVEIIHGDASTRVTKQVSDKRLDARTQADEADSLLKPEEVAKQMGLKTRQSVHVWLKQGRLVGWQGAKRGYLLPAGQFDDRGRPPDGLTRIVPLFEDGYAAWIWLTSPLAALDGSEPLTLLRQGEIDRVVAAANGDAQGDFS